MQPPWRNGSGEHRLARRRPLQLAVTGGVIIAIVVAIVCFGVRQGASAVSNSQPARGGAAGTAAAPVGAAAAPAGKAPSRLPQLGAAQVVETDDVGDPYILDAPHGVTGDPSARYVLFWTTDWRSNVPTAVSSDLVHWHRIADALPVLPSWATNSATLTWGPAAMAVKGGWVLYFGTQEASSHVQCIGSGFSTNPAGPFVDSSPTPLVCQQSLGGSIDPSVVHSGATVSLVWKNDGNATGAAVSIWQQQLAPDGQALVGPRHQLLKPDQSWQGGIIEGPAMLSASKGGWWLFYSGGSWQSNTYATGVAWCASVTGPCAETSTAPFLGGLPTAVSPGGLETFRDNSGRLWASYSAFPSRPANPQAAMAENRVLEIAPVTAH